MDKSSAQGSLNDGPVSEMVLYLREYKIQIAVIEAGLALVSDDVTWQAVRWRQAFPQKLVSGMVQ